jgi:uncharacterized membrane protein required for colicin V production
VTLIFGQSTVIDFSLFQSLTSFLNQTHHLRDSSLLNVTSALLDSSAFDLTSDGRQTSRLILSDTFNSSSTLVWAPVISWSINVTLTDNSFIIDLHTPSAISEASSTPNCSESGGSYLAHSPSFNESSGIQKSIDFLNSESAIHSRESTFAATFHFEESPVLNQSFIHPLTGILEVSGVRQISHFFRLSFDFAESLNISFSNFFEIESDDFNDSSELNSSLTLCSSHSRANSKDKESTKSRSEQRSPNSGTSREVSIRTASPAVSLSAVFLRSPDLKESGTSHHVDVIKSSSKTSVLLHRSVSSTERGVVGGLSGTTSIIIAASLAALLLLALIALITIVLYRRRKTDSGIPESEFEVETEPGQPDFEGMSIESDWEAGSFENPDDDSQDVISFSMMEGVEEVVFDPDA